MRVISGKYRGKRLFAPEGKFVRPTTDRIKETVFNILSSKNDFEGACILDLFAGSGALGIEALSRGAKSAVFIDNSAESVKYIRANLANVGIDAQVYNTDFRVALRKLSGKEKFDYIFIDPPYFAQVEKVVFDLIEEYNILSEKGIIFWEHSTKIDLPELEKRYIIDTRKCGITYISFLYRRDND